MKVDLPWPPKELSPNARLHWAKVAKYKKDYRLACWALTKQAAAGTKFRDKKTEVDIEFFPPSKRHYDLDNCLASMKAGLDGVADALLINDHHFKLTVRMQEDVLGLVRLTIRQE